ncbi:clusterin-associated protein 1-like isoform X2 [Penaeus japonicus]|uniref:clusterin-associated protein 1-like isoform X2 n=1 Tax=Penaeus japonicus TaxID=27405 RepID=UPI001C71726F|nr:clusterin-associated protein 1-like isoform X2 [Penaeus japonicus]
MSYREIRNLIEHLRSLGFTRLVSLENFSTPNFPLVAEILIWSIKMVDSDSDISDTIDCEQDRVILIRMAAVFFYQKLGLRLNTLRLYGADKLAARELLKVTSGLYQAMQTALNESTCTGDEVENQKYSTSLSGKELREVRQLASTIVMDATALHDSLKREVDYKSKRQAVMEQALDVDSMEATVVSALHSVSAAIAQIKESTEQLVHQGTEIDEKIQKKRESLARNKKRLAALQKIKPSWQTEFEQEENELRQVWDDYITKHKNLMYLEGQLQEQEDQQQQQLKDTLALAAKREKEGALAALATADTEVNSPPVRSYRHVFGSMTGGDDESSSDDSFLEESGSEDSLTLSSVTGNKGSEYPSLTSNAGPSSSNVLSAEGLSKSLGNYQTSVATLSGRPASARPSSARPKSAHSGSRVNNLNVWTNVKGSGRVSPLSASEDNSDDAF